MIRGMRWRQAGLVVNGVDYTSSAPVAAVQYHTSRNCARLKAHVATVYKELCVRAPCMPAHLRQASMKHECPAA
jgi:hypothetical protein